MQDRIENAIAFGTCLREDPDAARFYDSCTPLQRQAILRQLHAIETPEQMKDFVDHLSSAVS